MAMNFPSSPTEGQTYAAPGGPTYTFTGGLWALPMVTGGGASIEVKDTPPTSPDPDSLWWESDTGSLFLFYDDGNTQQWVQVNGTSGGPQTGNWAIRLNPSTITENATIPTGFNGMSAGPITIADGVTVTVADGSEWAVV